MSRIRTWFLATRPWSFSMSAITVAIGSLWPSADPDRGISWAIFWATLAAMVFLHGATNLLNDYFDVRNKVDVPDAPTTKYRPHPLARAEIGLRQVLAFALALYAVGGGIGLALAWLRGPELIAIGAAGVAISVMYTGTRLALKYHALGEIAVFLVWGPLAMLGAHFAQAQAFSASLSLVSVPFGALVGLVLLANNIRDVDYDARQGITTLPVLLGARAGRMLFIAMVALAYASVLVMSALGPLGPWSLLVLASLPVAYRLCRMLYDGVPDDADARTAQLDTVFGILLIVSLVMERVIQ